MNYTLIGSSFLVCLMLAHTLLKWMTARSTGCMWRVAQDRGGFLYWEAFQTGIYRPLANRGVVHETAQGIWYWRVCCGWGPTLARGTASTENEALALVNEHIQD